MHLLACGSTKIAADGYHEDSDASFFSHAHSDHLAGAGRAKKVVASDETFALAGLRGEKVSYPGLTLHNAGHILGARQLRVEGDGAVTVYTGDFCLKDGVITKGAELLQCDRLVMEATYGSPEYKFGGHEEACGQVAGYVKANDSANIIIGAYELGKAQEIVKILNEHCGIAPVVNEKTGEFCRTYGQFGVKLDYSVVGSEEAEETMRRRFVAIVPMRHAKRYFARRLAEAFERKTLATAATGWALTFRLNVDHAFPLSDHADFDDLKHYIEQSGAKEVEFFQGDGAHLMQALKMKQAQTATV